MNHELTYADGEAERMALAASNSELRSRLLKLGTDYEVALATIESLHSALGETELLLEAVDRKRLELAATLTSIAMLVSEAKYST